MEDYLKGVEELELLFKAVLRESERRMTEGLASLGVTPAQAEALGVLQMAQPISLGDLGSLLIAEGGHPSRLVDRLVRNGWVERRVAESDRRRLVLSLTPTGVELVERIEAARELLCADKRDLIENSDLTPTMALFEGYLLGSPWWETVERRRRLAREAEAALDRGGSEPRSLSEPLHQT
ncbi:MAG: MarR family winged helix-turn-helix transcriptional regulator [Geitlerinemataceae cyanobacterium]